MFTGAGGSSVDRAEGLRVWLECHGHDARCHERDRGNSYLEEHPPHFNTVPPTPALRVGHADAFPERDPGSALRGQRLPVGRSLLLTAAIESSRLSSCPPPSDVPRTRLYPTTAMLRPDIEQKYQLARHPADTIVQWARLAPAGTVMFLARISRRGTGYSASLLLRPPDVLLNG